MASDSSFGNVNQSLRIARVSKIYKMIRFVRLARLAKGVKKLNTPSMKASVKIREGKMRLIMFAGTLLIGIHCFASFWLAMQQFD